MHYPYKAEVLRTDEDTGEEVWWPVTSDEEDNILVGDGIPGDKKTAEFGARCANAAYRQALNDIFRALNDSLPSEKSVREKLLGTSH